MVPWSPPDRGFTALSLNGVGAPDLPFDALRAVNVALQHHNRAFVTIFVLPTQTLTRFFHRSPRLRFLPVQNFAPLSKDHRRSPFPQPCRAAVATRQGVKRRPWAGFLNRTQARSLFREVGRRPFFTFRFQIL
jgi:hypothetical protein